MNSINQVIDGQTIYNIPVMSRVPKTARRILDIGCGAGVIGKQIKQIMDCEIIGITNNESEVATSSEWLDKVVLHDLNEIFPRDKLGEFDCIICCHVLEHLYQPQQLLQQIKSSIKSDGILVVALPNILFWKQRLEFLKGCFRYADDGLTDRTHFRFFDWQTSHQLLKENGYRILNSEGNGFLPLPMIRNYFPKSSVKLDRIATEQFPGLFGWQFVFTCQVESV
ncbi:MAG: methyltransferase domain-containing protein [Roseofilum sp. SBFL]|uniref:class I SAM-dependent methyltransferase n=1 Tax=unclassified Roseofilum TaxID=2620099 RepID=UPI001B0DB5DE|nr:MULTISPECIES: methyltransferase domain-containing protein [unclassified Roseofilum]MBP0014388.1 methyltransferase domain-containing protein [Roseofilum sp. SID3]MBP0025953.1 methyltransferase domain-containing protein [Roseofilum sp. SID2]MBP0036125.1 methyltransferase domain-containing protein [Roseofilum sp. SID1]MBP0040493.1 methyltransferase domain-containing protein [Roseofilum sp. SBFL]